MILNKPYVISDIKKTTNEVTSFTFKAQDGTSIDFTPGMFAMLTYTDQGAGQKVSRAFSIANSPPSDQLEFFISMIHGQLTSKLESAKAGDIYLVSAPYGQFKFDMNQSGKVLFLAGGTGLAPFFSMLRQLVQNNKKMDCVLIYSVKYPSEIIEKGELEKITQTLNAKLAVTVTRPAPGDGWTGETGHVNADMIKKYAQDFLERVVYICGPPAFVKALKEALVGLGVDEKRIKAEMWG